MLALVANDQSCNPGASPMTPIHVYEDEGETLGSLLLLLLHRRWTTEWREVRAYRFLLLQRIEDDTHDLVYKRLTVCEFEEDVYSEFIDILPSLETKEVRIR